jgi:hypothetical protein
MLDIAIASALAAAGNSEGGLRLTKGMVEGVVWREQTVKNDGMVMLKYL